MAEDQEPKSETRPVAPAVSPRPHWITIVTSALSPLAVIAAIVFSYLGYQTSQEGLRTSQMSLQYGQRAYLTVKNTRVEVWNSVDGLVTEVGPDGKPTDNNFPQKFVLFSYDVVNQGNTPGRVTKASLSVKQIPGSWAYIESRPRTLVDNERYSLGRSDSVRRSFDTITLRAPDGEQRELEYLKQHGGAESLDPLVLQADLEYTDVFGNSHSVSWCSVTRFSSLGMTHKPRSVPLERCFPDAGEVSKSSPPRSN
jgi:hypothetical protein